MKLAQFQFNAFGVNCYLLWDEATHEAMIIDPGCSTPQELAQLQRVVTQEQLQVKYMVATHLHIDHILGSAQVSQCYGVPFGANEADAPLLERAQGQAAMFGITLTEPLAPIALPINEGDCFTLGAERIEAIHVPGHSPGSIVYHCAAQRILFAGDTLFRHSIGRTDLPLGSAEQLLHHIAHKLMTLDPETVVMTGHGASTTIGYEAENNPYL